MASKRRLIAVLNLSRHVPDLSKQGRAIVHAMDGNPAFPNPTPTLAKVADDLLALDTAEARVMTRVKGAAEARDVQKAVVVSDLQQLRSIVQGAADADPERADILITGAGMSVKTVNPRQKNVLAAKQGAVSGVVALIAALAADKAFYLWQWSTDQETWTSLPAVLVTRTILGGLTSGTTYYFRYHAVTSAGVSDWSQVVALLVR